MFGEETSEEASGFGSEITPGGFLMHSDSAFGGFGGFGLGGECGDLGLSWWGGAAPAEADRNRPGVSGRADRDDECGYVWVFSGAFAGAPDAGVIVRDWKWSKTRIGWVLNTEVGDGWPQPRE